MEGAAGGGRCRWVGKWPVVVGTKGRRQGMTSKSPFSRLPALSLAASPFSSLALPLAKSFSPPFLNHYWFFSENDTNYYYSLNFINLINTNTVGRTNFDSSSKTKLFRDLEEHPCFVPKTKRGIYIFTERKRGRSSLSKVFRPLCLFSYAVTVSRKSGPSPLLYFYGGRKLVGIFPSKVSLRKDEARNNNTTGTASLSFTFARRKLVGNLSAVVLFHDISTRSFSSKKKKKEILTICILRSIYRSSKKRPL